MKILVVEDNEEKREAVHAFARDALGGEVDIAKSYYDAKIALHTSRYDLVLLDMSLPVYGVEEGGSGSILVYGGEDLLAWVKLMRIPPSKVFIISQFDAFSSSDGKVKRAADLERRLAIAYPGMFYGWVNYRDTDNSWQTQLQEKINALGEQP